MVNYCPCLLNEIHINMSTAFTPRYLAWFNWLMPIEGTVYEDDPNDPGGATKFGIDQRSHPKLDIRNLTLDDARQIYWDETWTANSADSLPPGVGEVVCRIGMNCGERLAVEWLQTLIGVKVDGSLGPKTIAAANAVDAKKLTSDLINRMETYYRNLAAGSSKRARYLKGWLNAAEDLRRFVNA